MKQIKPIFLGGGSPTLSFQFWEITFGDITLPKFDK